MKPAGTVRLSAYKSNFGLKRALISESASSPQPSTYRPASTAKRWRSSSSTSSVPAVVWAISARSKWR
jgi:hypothetical protein